MLTAAFGMEKEAAARGKCVERNITPTASEARYDRGRVARRIAGKRFVEQHMILRQSKQRLVRWYGHCHLAAETDASVRVGADYHRHVARNQQPIPPPACFVRYRQHFQQ